MQNLKGITIAGSIIVDKINEISAYPTAGELTQIKGISKAVGGCVPNVAIDLVKLAPDLKVEAVGKIGNDDDGKFVLNNLSSAGVGVSDVKISNEVATSFTDVMNVKNGERTFFTYPGASADFGYDDVDYDNVSTKLFHLGYFLLLDKIDNGDGEKMLKTLQERNIITSIDLVSENSDRYKIVIPCLKYTDNVIINELEASKIAEIPFNGSNLKEIAQKIKSYGVKDKVIIHMPLCSALLDNNEYIELPSIDIPKDWIKGKTGAGDAFCAGCLLSIYNELSNVEILQNGSYAATMALSSVDAVSGMVDLATAKKICDGFNK